MILKEGLNLEKKASDYIEWLSEFGKDSEGGITRLLYTDEWMQAQEGLKEFMKEKDFQVYTDEVGNLFGRLEGSKYTDETILTGSHIDTVVNGGKLDGQLGIVGGIIAIEFLREHYGQPLRNIEVVSMAEEEGSRFPFAFWGSKNIIGMAKRELVENIQDSNGVSFVEEMHRCGFDFKEQEGKCREDLKAFIELHIEQGGVLEIEKKPIGVVEHIVGQKRFTIEVKGEANHAGTTPMCYRKDALHATSEIIRNTMALAKKYGDPLVTTVGRLEVEPNTVNVVPGKVTFSLDIRHTCKDTLAKFTEKVILDMKKIAKDMDVKINTEMWMDCDPIAMDERLVNIIKNQCEENNLNYKLMHSGAGHDSQIFAKVIPTAMIFVPSHKGISHSPQEFTEPKDYVEGIKALIKTLYYLAYK